jgi:aryl-alcohol dehydrogenase-like predicted oxidoreductase
MAFIPYFPLASGLLTGKYSSGTPAPAGTRLSQAWAANRFLTDDRLARVDALGRLAGSRGHSLLELAMSWLLRHPVVSSVIAGATTPAQARANAGAAFWRLTAEDLAAVDRIAPASHPESAGRS